MLIGVEEFPAHNGGAAIQGVLDSFGDDAAIIAATLARWNVPSTLISPPVGNDYYGNRVLEQLTASGIDVAQRVDRGLTTPLEVGIVDGTGSRTYFQERDPGALASLPIPSVSELSEARILYVDWYDGGRVIEAMERARDLGVPVFLNLESKYCDAPNLSDLLRLTNVCQVSMDEPQASGNPPDIARDLLAEGVDVALITLGAEGCIVAQGTQLFRIRPPKVKVIDGYGAGAAFSAGVIYGIQAEWPLERSARFATAYAGLKCGMAGSPVLAVDALQETAKGLPSQLLSL